MLHILQDINFNHDNKIYSGFLTRKGGVSSGLFASMNMNIRNDEDIANVKKNYQILADHLKINVNKIYVLKQIHSNNVITINEGQNFMELPEGDAMVTAACNHALGVLSADCTPILFYDSKNQIIGAAHSGWKGAFSNIVQQTIAAMVNLGADIPEITACIGPTIAQENYEVDGKFYQNFIEQNSANSKFFIDSINENHFMFDLKGCIKENMENIGIKKIYDINKDTYSDEENFYSFRRRTHKKEAANGLQLSIIMLK